MAAGQAIFQNKLLTTLPRTSPGLNPALVAAVGATDIRKAFDAVQLPGILSAYMEGLHSAFTLAIPVAGVAFLFSLPQRWFRLHKPEANNSDEDKA